MEIESIMDIGGFRVVFGGFVLSCSAASFPLHGAGCREYSRSTLVGTSLYRYPGGPLRCTLYLTDRYT